MFDIMVITMRVILHSDLNSFYSSVELLHRPQYRGVPFAVGGDEEARHGIVLAKNDLAKKFNIKTGMTLREARQSCPDLVTVPANIELYLRFSRMARDIYSCYTDRIESFGIDEVWADISNQSRTIEDGAAVADEIRLRIQKELGVTVSIGVSFNKIIAKLGSDLKKPNATSVISKENFKQVVWPLPVSDLLYVGRATEKKLLYRGIRTIGDLAKQDPKYLRSFLHKPGEQLWAWANGQDFSPVAKTGDEQIIKSIGNSITASRDLMNETDVLMVFTFLAESVATRLRESGFECQTVSISIRDNELHSFERQKALQRPTTLVNELVDAAMYLFKRNYRWYKPVRSIGIRGMNLTAPNYAVQLSIFENEERRARLEAAERAVDRIRARYGYRSIRRGITMLDDALTSVDAKNEHTVHPVAYKN